MKNLLCLTAILFGLCAGCFRSGTQDGSPAALPKPAQGLFFVATNGQDAWSGRLSAPNRRGTDGPFATLSAALKAVRAARLQAGSPSQEPMKILVGEGTHFQTQPLVLTPEDSGLELAAYPGAKPILSAGRSITGWREAAIEGKKLWTADIPEVRVGQWLFRELWVNGQRATRARHPNRGYLPIAELPDKTKSWEKGHSRFRFREGDLKAWSSLTNAEVLAMTRWVESRLPVVSVDEKERIVTFGKRSVFELAPGDLYCAEGAFEFLDEPGEWCLAPGAGTLYYLPRPGETLDAVHAVAPVLPQVLRFESRPEAGQYVKRITLRGLTFSHTEWHFPSDLHSATNKPNAWPPPAAEVGGFAQAAYGVSGAVYGDGLRGATFEDCRFANLGNYGLELARGCQSNRIARCEFSDLGAGGLKLGETHLRASSAEQSGANEVTHCHIHDGGKFFASAVGIWIGQSPGNRITHNLIHDFYYTGISIGWTWGYGPALASNNLVALNHVHHIGAKSSGDGPILSDMGGIYTLGRQPGTTIRSNLWHDIAATRYGGWGIYFDEGTSGILAEDNIVYRTTHGGFHQHYGQTNIIRNNIFAFARDHQVQRTRPEPHRSFSFVTNIVYFDSGHLLAGDLSGDNYLMDSNLYFDARPDAKPDQLRLGPCTWQKWRERGHDQHSLLADPLFVVPGKHDFQLRPDSPAFKLGFRPIDLTGVGP
ncbi:MAG TPA: right-handed parallel beta-helix repeat-containing protein [Candidatus Paceibacterota bacterium]|nr:right-handed parallel beta-helix repeat-containing protein [Verrucomicrobiota bacterium]HSA09033.1 right-handed parallel beta-helix repeat-containing protein [Candidatus Paceibacterota bacterium]